MSKKSELPRLISRVQDGDPDAFGVIYERFFDSVYTYVFQQVGSSADAEDITSTVFLEIFEKISDFRWRGAGFAAWMFRIAHNDVLDHFRRGRRRELDSGIEDIASEIGVDQIVEKNWSERRLRQAIGLLSEEQQQVVLLKLMLNFSNGQIGEVLGKSEGAVKALQHRAQLALRNILDEGKDSKDNRIRNGTTAKKRLSFEAPAGAE